MKIQHAALLLAVALIGCKSYIQVFEVASPSLSLEEEHFVYENDSVRFEYTFWASQGVLSFTIHNKLTKPIYIDWRKSSFIVNDQKYDYWIDEETTRMAAISAYGNYLSKNVIFGNSAMVGATQTTKPERVTFIPPNSNYGRDQFKLLPMSYFNIDPQTAPQEVPLSGNAKKKTEVYQLNFTKETTPLIFRNFIGYSMNEDGSYPVFVDNEFYLSHVIEMDYRHFKYKVKVSPSQYDFVKPFKKKFKFYIRVPNGYATAYRKKF